LKVRGQHTIVIYIMSAIMILVILEVEIGAQLIGDDHRPAAASSAPDTP
jgi:hypothetical protein